MNKPTSRHANADSLSLEQKVDETTIFNIAQVEALPVTALQVATANVLL